MMKIVIACWLLLLGLFSVKEQADGAKENLARRGSAYQSTTSDSQYTADRAIDGTYAAPCAVTSWSAYSWWRLDLQAAYPVNIVVVTYREDSFPENTRDISVRFGNSLYNGYENHKCSVISSVRANSTVTYSCGEEAGRYFTISIGMDLLSVCEVEVYETDDQTQMYLPATYSAKRLFMKIALTSSANLTDPTVTDQVLKELTSALAERGITNATLSWSQTPEEEVIQSQVENDPC